MSRLLIVLVLFLIQFSFSTPVDSFTKRSVPLKLLIDSLEINSKNLAIQIDKSDYKLSIVSDDNVIKEYAVVFGDNPIDDKLMQGDQCTPEGTFSVRDLYPHKSWSKFIWIDYPNEASWEKHTLAKEKGQIPADAKIGGEIGIHGVPEGFDYAIPQRQNWTLGCISLTNKDVNEIYPYVFRGMIVTISK